MNLAFLLHLYQPPTQQEPVFKNIVQNCYLPLFKLIKSTHGIKVTVNTPLSLLELLDKNGYTEVLDLIRDLADTEKVELTGSGAFHPLLARLPKEIAYKQIVLNEYGLGYYFGHRQGFEGENAVLIKDINGFFAPELNVNDALHDLLSQLNYSWAVVDKISLGMPAEVEGQVFTIGERYTKIVVRNTALSDIISVTRDSEIDSTVNALSPYVVENRDVLIALDGEIFGHHNKEGVYYFDQLMDRLKRMNVAIVSVSDYIRASNSKKALALVESSWSSYFDKKGEVVAYPLWDNPKNELQQNLWALNNLVVAEFMAIHAPHIEAGYENIPVWRPSELQKISNSSVKDFVSLELLVMRSLHSDQFWWASQEEVFGKLLFSKEMIFNALTLYQRIADSPLMHMQRAKIIEHCALVAELLNK